MKCPKCHGTMRTYDRSGVHIEQCDSCRGIFLDYGELEAVARIESQWAQQAPPPVQHGGPAQPAWGHQGGGHGGHGGHYRQKSWSKLLFSS